MSKYMKKMTVRDLPVNRKRVLMRVDFNVPIEKGKVTNSVRIAAAMPTINYLLEQDAKVILMSHLGRPKGKVNPDYSLQPVAAELAKISGAPVAFAPDCVGAEAEAMALSLRPGEILLLENLRFHPEEEANDPDFAKQLARLGEVYVDDAFGTAHRAHASTEGVAHLLPAVIGLLMEKEVEGLGAALADPASPFVAVIGGAKVNDKILVIDNLLKKIDKLLTGGGIAYTFLTAAGHAMEESLVEVERLDWARELLQTEAAQKILLPVDVVAAAAFDNQAETRVVGVDEVPPGWQALDIGPETVKRYAAELAKAETIVWNGPLGVFEMPTFSRGTMAIAEAVAHSNAFSIVGGGDSVAAIHQAGVSDYIGHLSTGGGASLKFLEGKPLPGLKVIMDQPE